MAEPSDHSLARDLATEVGALLLKVRAQHEEAGSTPAEIKDAGDLAAHDHIVDALTTSRPNDALLSEEGKDDQSRLNSDRVWIVDPLDGTREFSEAGRTDWAVHIALTEGGVPTAGAVALPAQGITLATAEPPTLTPARSGPPRVIVSRTRRPPAAVALAAALDAEYIEMGSAGAKAMAVVQGTADIYAHSGGQYEWDNCAPVAVARAAGLHCSRLDGRELEYNRSDPYLPDLLICRPEWTERCLEALQA